MGKPAILLKTTDGGATWERVPLSSKLPGTPLVVTALEGDGNAEMTTDQGAIYVTSNGGDLWKAAVEETVDATLNRTVSSGISGASFYTGSFSSIKRGAEGNYIAVSSRGNFYMTWEPGQSTWLPHNRFSARRLQDMGFRNDEAVDVEAVIVLGVRDGALQQLADILGRTLRRELQLGQCALDRKAADLLGQQVQLLRAGTVHAQNSAGLVGRLLRRILGFSHDYFLFAFLSAPWP